MAASVASYGQKIVSEFTFQNGNMISNTDLVECSDGTLLTAIAYYKIMIMKRVCWSAK